MRGFALAVFVVLAVAVHAQDGQFDQAAVDLPTLQLAVVAAAMADDLLGALDQLDRILVDAAQDEAALVGSEREAEPEIGLSATGLPAIEEFVGLAGESLRLRAWIRRPRTMCGGALHQQSERLPLIRASGADPFEDLIKEFGRDGDIRCGSHGLFLPTLTKSGPISFPSAPPP